MEAPAQVIVDAPLTHLCQRMKHHFEIALAFGMVIVAQEKLIDPRIGKFRRLSQPAVVRIIGAGNLLGTLPDRIQRESAFRFLRFGHPLQGGENLVDAFLNILRFFAVRLGDARQDSREAGHTLAIFGREIGPAVEGLAVGCEKRRHGPAAPAGQHLHRVHVDLVEIRALLAIDLDTDEKIVHQGSDLFVLERLVLHHVAPVAGGVADA